ncbi:MAG: hypothetical protein AAF900_02310 [Bacteroidota bacterium]
MYYKQSLMSPSYILKLSLWLLFGCSILGNDLYASENNETNKDEANIGEYINTLFGEAKDLKGKYLAATKIKKNFPIAANIIEKIDKDRLSDEQKEALEYLTDKKNTVAIHNWVCRHYLKLNNICYYIQQQLRKILEDSNIYPYRYQLNHAPLDKEASPQAIATYLNELENVRHGYKDMSKVELYTTTAYTTLATCKQYITLQNHVIIPTLLNDLARWKNQVEGLKKLIHDNLSCFEETDSAAYDKIKAAADQLSPADMDKCLAEINKKLQAQENNALDHIFEDSFVFNIEKASKKLENAVKNKQIDDILSAYDLALKHLLYTHINGDSVMPRQHIDQLIAQMTAASQVAYPPNTANNSFPATSGRHLAHFIAPLVLLSYQLSNKNKLSKLGTNASSKFLALSKKSQSAASNFAAWCKSLSKGKKSAAVTAGALITLGTGHKIYKKYFAKEKKASTTLLALTFPQKNWLLFMLCLLIGGLLMVSIFYRKKTRA